MGVVDLYEAITGESDCSDTVSFLSSLVDRDEIDPSLVLDVCSQVSEELDELSRADLETVDSALVDLIDAVPEQSGTAVLIAALTRLSQRVTEQLYGD